MKRLSMLVLCLSLGAAARGQTPAPVDYASEVQPIFTRSCASQGCHGRVTSGVRLTSYETVTSSVGSRYRRPVITPGDAADSPLFDKISQASPRFGSRMPFGAAPLPDEEIETIRRWIDEGALAEPPPPVDYDTEVQPIFDRSCANVACHGSPTSGVLLTDYEAVLASTGLQYGQRIVTPGDVDASPLLEKIASESPRFGSRMPFGAAPLSDEEIQTIRRWILEGATRKEPLDRGDFDRNETINISDAVLLLNFLFAGGASPLCDALVDTNADGSVNLSDAVFLLSFLFVSGPAPAPISDTEHASCP